MERRRGGTWVRAGDGAGAPRCPVPGALFLQLRPPPPHPLRVRSQCPPRSPPPPQVLNASRPDWSRALSFYRSAASVCPSSGNPYNQLAVIAVNQHDELRAVYYYFRSLAVATPFATARDNLLLLFERNRAK